MNLKGIREDLIYEEYKSRFNPCGGWVEFGIVQDSVEKISAKTYMLPLQKTSVKTYLSSLIYYRGSANCFFLGKISPVTGAFITAKNSTYVYTGIEAQYGLGPLKILPSFTVSLKIGAFISLITSPS